MFATVHKRYRLFGCRLPQFEVRKQPDLRHRRKENVGSTLAGAPMNFRISGLEPGLFAHYFKMTDAELSAHRALRRTVESRPGFPCRVSLSDLAPGEEAILLNYEHLAVDSPYRASHAIYVGAGSREAFDRIDEIPQALATRLLSVRAFSTAGVMGGADVVEGRELPRAIDALLKDAKVDFLPAPSARAGFFSPGGHRPLPPLPLHQS